MLGMECSCHKERHTRGGASTCESLSLLPSLECGFWPSERGAPGRPGTGPVAREALNGLKNCGLSCSVWGTRGLGAIVEWPGPTALWAGASLHCRACDSGSPPSSTSGGH